jgi:PAS domain S-box-containing protein
MYRIIKKNFDIKGVIFSAFLFVTISAIVIYGFYYSKSKYSSSQKAEFDKSTAIVESLLSRRMQVYISALYNAKAFVATAPSLSAKDWKNYVNSAEILNRYPGIFAISYIERVFSKDKQTFTESVVNDKSIDPAGYPQFAIHPESNSETSYVIKFIEPFAGRQAAFGLDWTTDPIRSEALNVAIKTGEPKLSRVYTSASTGESVFGAIIPAEIDKSGVRNLVLFTFAPQELFKDVLHDFAMDSQIRLEIYQSEYQQNKPIKIFDTNPTTANDGGVSFAKESETQFLGQRWILKFSSLASGVLVNREISLSYLILALGLLFGFAVSLLTYKILSINTTIRKSIEETKKELESERHRLEIIFNNSPDTILLIKIDEAGGLGGFIEANKISLENLGYSKEELFKMSPASLQNPKAKQPIDISKITSQLLKNGTAEFEMEVLAKNGKVIFVEAKATLISYIGGRAVLLIARDISERKSIEKTLEEKLKELEKLNKLLLGREVKMVKIKEELETLKNINNGEKP